MHNQAALMSDPNRVSVVGSDINDLHVDGDRISVHPTAMGELQYRIEEDIMLDRSFDAFGNYVDTGGTSAIESILQIKLMVVIQNITMVMNQEDWVLLIAQMMMVLIFVLVMNSEIFNFEPYLIFNQYDNVAQEGLGNLRAWHLRRQTAFNVNSFLDFPQRLLLC